MVWKKIEHLGSKIYSKSWEKLNICDRIIKFFLKAVQSTKDCILPIKNLVPGWVVGWMGVKAILKVAYCNQKFKNS